MNDQNVHPLIRYGGPVLGAVIVYFIITSMIGGFQADIDAARVTPLAPAEQVAGEAPAGEAPAAEAPAAETPAPEVAESAAVTETESITETGALTETAPLAETEPVTQTETLTETAPVAESTEVTTTVELEIEETAPVTETETVTETVPLEVATPEPTEVPATPEAAAPVAPADAGGEDIYAGLPDNIAAFFPDGADAEVGEQTALTSGCTACHSLLPDVVQVGPSWYGVADRAGERVLGQSAALYLYTSITDPTAYVVPDFQSNLMPNIYNQLLTEQQIADIIAYLLTLEGE